MAVCSARSWPNCKPAQKQRPVLNARLRCPPNLSLNFPHKSMNHTRSRPKHTISNRPLPFLQRRHSPFLRPTRLHGNQRKTSCRHRRHIAHLTTHHPGSRLRRPPRPWRTCRWILRPRPVPGEVHVVCGSRMKGQTLSRQEHRGGREEV